MMKMAVESMEMAPGAIPRPGRVPEQRLLSLEACLRRRQSFGTFRGWRLIDLGFFALRAIYRRKGDVGGRPGGPHHVAARLGGPRRHQVWPPLWPPSGLLRTPGACHQNRDFGFCFVQFREYFQNNFSKIQK